MPMKHHLAALPGVTALALLALVLPAVLEPAAARGLSFSTKDLKSEEALWRLYNRWGKHYKVARPSSERLHRFRAFNATVHGVAALREASGQTATGLNIFADLSDEEFNRDYICTATTTPPPNVPDGPERRRGGNGNGTLAFMPESVDWRDKTCRGVPCLGQVRSQQGCGSCWAFAATGAMEANNAIAASTDFSIQFLPLLSVQELVDCDARSHRCAGGQAANAFRYTMDHGLSSAADYPYRAMNGTCHASSTSHVLSSTRGFLRVPRSDEFDEASLLWAVNRGPVVVRIAMTTMNKKGKEEVLKSFRYYDGGVYQLDCGTTGAGHELLLVGYNSDAYILKNSWGPGWGEAGYLLLSRDVGCDILKGRTSYFPLMS